MHFDIIKNETYLFLGSRLKRLSDNLLNDAAKIVHSEGFGDLYPSHMSILGVLAKIETISISQLAENLGIAQPSISRSIISLKSLGIINVTISENDSRQKFLSLTPKGQNIVKFLRENVWNLIEKIIFEMIGVKDTSLENHLNMLEAQLNKASLFKRYENLKNNMMVQNEIEIIEFDEIYANDFYNINAEWIEETFILEDIDKEVLKNPKLKIIDKGGLILLAKHKDLGIVGTCALMNMGNEVFELTKMGVLKKARNLKIGEHLLKAILLRAKNMKIKQLFLLTNKLAEAAIHLYEKLGFEHSQEIMEKFGHEYERCNVAMIYKDIN